MEAVGDREYRVPLVPLLEASDKGHGNPLEASNEGNSLKAGGGVDRIPLVICLGLVMMEEMDLLRRPSK